ncbi:MAG: DNA-binding protein [Actinobacteria bacterium]|nr:DNA-binding protein [Actinomycetota bacterium]
MVSATTWLRRCSVHPMTATQWLSNPRLGVYLQATSGDHALALELYDWNAQVASACLRDVGHFEVLVRNRYADKLSAHDANWTSASSSLWTLESPPPQPNGVIQKQRKANRKSKESLTIAHASLTNPASGHVSIPTSGQVIAELMFGFWQSLTLPVRDATLWKPILSLAVPGLSRGHVHDRMLKLNRFRNRLAHWEPVFSNSTGLALRLTEFENIFTDIDPDVAAWVGTRSTVLETIDQCPLPALMATPTNFLGRAL